MNTKCKPIEGRTYPDLDWSQVRETVLMLNLAVAQIERAMRDGDESVSTLAAMFTSMATQVEALREETPLAGLDGASGVRDSFASISDKVNTAIIGFQFYDRLAQRLAHVCHSLDSLAGLIGDPERLYCPFEWLQLQDLIRSKYVLEIDRKMFEAVLGGATVEEALALEEKLIKEAKEAEGKVEFF